MCDRRSNLSRNASGITRSTLAKAPSTAGTAPASPRLRAANRANPRPTASSSVNISSGSL
ncbi:MAG: hypothetical protein M3Q60_17345 [Actinomycetota bacterium]|nr:hypothetical protein [Actinomycetota bacterium]